MERLKISLRVSRCRNPTTIRNCSAPAINWFAMLTCNTDWHTRKTLRSSYSRWFEIEVWLVGWHEAWNEITFLLFRQSERKRQGVPSMADFIKQTLKKVNREQRQQQVVFTPQMLMTMNVTQLQIVINEIYDFRGILNETLVKNLMERDELLSKRDTMLMTIEKQSGRKRSVERENSC